MCVWDCLFLMAGHLRCRCDDTAHLSISNYRYTFCLKYTMFHLTCSLDRNKSDKMPPMGKPRILRNFIALEGIDGAGTTTQANRIDHMCRESGVPCWITCEPTEMPVGKLIRRILRGDLVVQPETLARLFAADRYEHIYGEIDGIVNHLRRGEMVVTDRYFFSSLAYQSVECGFETVFALNNQFPLPEILVYIDVPTEVGDRRASTRDMREIFEHTDFQSKARAMYERAMLEYSDSGIEVLRVDGTEDEDRVFEKLWSRLHRLPIEKV